MLAHMHRHTHPCLLWSQYCSLQSNADHVHAEVNGMYHCTVLLGLQGRVGGVGRGHTHHYTGERGRRGKQGMVREVRGMGGRWCKV